jgi:hypothetical protein
MDAVGRLRELSSRSLAFPQGMARLLHQADLGSHYRPIKLLLPRRAVAIEKPAEFHRGFTLKQVFEHREGGSVGEAKA